MFPDDESTHDWYDDHETVRDQFEGLSLTDKTALEKKVGEMALTSNDPADAWLMGLTKVWMRKVAEEAAEKAIDSMKAAKKEAEWASSKPSWATFVSQCEAAAKQRRSAKEATNLIDPWSPPFMTAAEEEGPDHQSINLEAPD